jgi:hypothetical protein
VTPVRHGELLGHTARSGIPDENDGPPRLCVPRGNHDRVSRSPTSNAQLRRAIGSCRRVASKRSHNCRGYRSMGLRYSNKEITMTSPIASRVDDPRRSWESSSDDELTCKEEPGASAGSSGRVGADVSASSPGSGTGTTTSSEVQGPHAEVHLEEGDYYAGAFALKGRDGASGVEVEVFSASIHENDDERAVQIGMARMGGSTDDGHFAARGEVFTAQAHSGIHNADGSTGFGASMGATVVGGEATGTLGPVSLTAGASVGSTVGASIGVRDGDRDGKREICGRVEFGVGTVGLCVEKWW